MSKCAQTLKATNTPLKELNSPTRQQAKACLKPKEKRKIRKAYILLDRSLGLTPAYGSLILSVTKKRRERPRESAVFQLQRSAHRYDIFSATCASISLLAMCRDCLKVQVETRDFPTVTSKFGGAAATHRWLDHWPTVSHIIFASLIFYEWVRKLIEKRNAT